MATHRRQHHKGPNIQLLRQEPIELGSRRLPLVIARHPRAKYLTLRYQPLGDEVRLTLPRHCTITEGLQFIASKRSWLEELVGQHRGTIPFTPGTRLPILGKEYTLVHAPEGRGGAYVEGDQFIVTGAEEFIPRRTRDGIKKLFMQHIEPLARAKAAAIGAPVKRIAVRETRSRWGSCSADGVLSFSWRLSFAPLTVLDYVVSHEVAHLREMNHSDRFWQWVEALCPHYTQHRRWLHDEGHILYMYGGA